MNLALKAFFLFLAYIFLGVLVWTLVDPSVLTDMPIMVFFWPIIFDVFSPLILFVLGSISLIICFPKIIRNRFFLSIGLGTFLTLASILIPFHVDPQLVQFIEIPYGDVLTRHEANFFRYGRPFPFITQINRHFDAEAIARFNPIRISSARETPTDFDSKDFILSLLFWICVSWFSVELIRRLWKSKR